MKKKTDNSNKKQKKKEKEKNLTDRSGKLWKKEGSGSK